MNFITSIFASFLFFILSPNILLRLPKNGSKYTIAGVHAIVFGLIIFLFQSLIFKMFGLREGLNENCEENSEGEYNLKNGKCVKHEGYENNKCDEGHEDDGEWMKDHDGNCVKRNN
jgi:hypothetical protein